MLWSVSTLTHQTIPRAHIYFSLFESDANFWRNAAAASLFPFYRIKREKMPIVTQVAFCTTNRPSHVTSLVGNLSIPVSLTDELLRFQYPIQSREQLLSLAVDIVTYNFVTTRTAELHAWVSMLYSHAREYRNFSYRKMQIRMPSVEKITC